MFAQGIVRAPRGGGRQLLAHEPTHVIQQGDSGGLHDSASIRHREGLYPADLRRPRGSMFGIRGGRVRLHFRAHRENPDEIQ
ncbi:MAG: DUF4157 domain-containing protein, partial [Nitrospira sp.]|nr:DUF4157 domain-containing protein [Nitrospira sp.]